MSNEINIEVKGRLFKATHPEKPYLYYLFTHSGVFLYVEGDGVWVTTEWKEDQEQKVEEFVFKRGGTFTSANKLMFVIDTGMSIEQSFIVCNTDEEGSW
jgi:hypothetical protein